MTPALNVPFEPDRMLRHDAEGAGEVGAVEPSETVRRLFGVATSVHGDVESFKAHDGEEGEVWSGLCGARG